jgi:amino acid transporter
MFGQITGPASVDYCIYSPLSLLTHSSACSAMLLAAIAMYNENYTPQPWQVFLLTCALLVVHAALASMPTVFLAKFNEVGAVINFLAIIVFMVAVPAADINHPKMNSSSEVWTKITNSTEWPDSFAIMMSFLAVIWTLGGYDFPFHLTEEIRGANIATPRAIVITSSLGVLFGFLVLLIIAYTVGDVDQIFKSPLGQPMGAYLLSVLGKRVAMGVYSLIIISCFFEGLGGMIVSSRLIYAYSRDGALPGSRIWATINQRTQTPIFAGTLHDLHQIHRIVWLDCLIGILLNLLIFAGPIAILAVFAIGALAQYVAFVTPIAIKTFFVREKFKQGPWNLGRFSQLCGYIAIGWILLVLPIVCFPPVKGSNLTPSTMNWTCVVYGVPILCSLIWYAVSARKWFKGPKVPIIYSLLNL